MNMHALNFDFNQFFTGCSVNYPQNKTFRILLSYLYKAGISC